MSDMNSALSTWQLVLLLVVPLALLTGWLAAIFIAAREPRRPAAATAAPATLAMASDRGGAGPATVRESQPEPEAKQPVAA